MNKLRAAEVLPLTEEETRAIIRSELQNPEVIRLIAREISRQAQRDFNAGLSPDAQRFLAQITGSGAPHER